MKKLFAVITMFVLAAGVTVAQTGKTAAPASVDTKSQTKVTTNCDMNNFCCMRAGRMTRIKDGLEVGMNADMTLENGTKIATTGKVTSSKGNVTDLKEGDAIDMKGNLCVMGLNPAATPASAPAEVK